MKNYIFDLDGTLFDSASVWRDVDIEFLEKRGFTVPTDYAEAISALTLSQAAEYTIERFELKENAKDIVQEWTSMAAHAYATKVKLKPNVLEYLLALKASGAKLAIATSGAPELFEPALRNNGIFHLFDVICHAREVGVGKSSPAIFLLAAERLGVNPEDCILFDDLLVAIKTAKRIGMITYGVFDPAFEYEWEEIKKTADAVLYDFKSAPLPSSICYIVGAGDNYGLFSPNPGDYVIAADGGLDCLKKAGIKPDLVIGDFDSVVKKPTGEHVITLSSNKDFSDTMEAIKIGIRKGYDIFHIYCGTGGRFDHTFANVQALAYVSVFAKGGFLIGEDNITTAITNRGMSFPPGCHGYVSVFAYSDVAQGVTLKGLKFELENAELKSHLPIGLSNEFIGAESEISVKDGTLIIIFPKQKY